jgi:hypothetical protein
MLREPTVVDALERTYEAGQSLVMRSVQLLVAETRLTLRDGRSFVIGVVVGLVGWILLMRGAIDGLAQHYPRFAVELAVGLLHLGAATLLLVRRTPGLQPPREPER